MELDVSHFRASKGWTTRRRTFRKDRTVSFRRCLPRNGWDLDAEARIIVVGRPTTDVLRSIQERGVSDILACSEDERCLRIIRDSFEDPGTCGNDLGVRTWEGNLRDLPPYMGTADVVVFQGNFDQDEESRREALTRAGLLLKAGGRVIIVPLEGEEESCVPSKEALDALLAKLPLHLEQPEGEEDSCSVVLKQPDMYLLPGGPIKMEGTVVTGFGRGSKQMGVPTANLAPDEVDAATDLPHGVYFGWASVEGEKGTTGGAHKMVLNIGQRPTFVDGEGLSVEVHILHSFADDFYGKVVKVAVLSFLRPELKFQSLQDLVTRIQTDIGVARNILERTELQDYKALVE